MIKQKQYDYAMNVIHSIKMSDLINIEICRGALMHASVDLPTIPKGVKSNHLRKCLKKEKIQLNDRTSVEASYEMIESSVYGHNGKRCHVSISYGQITCMTCDYHADNRYNFSNHRCKNFQKQCIVDVPCV